MRLSAAVPTARGAFTVEARREGGRWTVDLVTPAPVKVAAATRNFMALELHSVDVPWWGDLVKPALSYKGGFIQVPSKPGLGIDELNEKLIKKQACADFPPPWTPTKEWDREWSNDRRWS